MTEGTGIHPVATQRTQYAPSPLSVIPVQTGIHPLLAVHPRPSDPLIDLRTLRNGDAMRERVSEKMMVKPSPGGYN